MALIKHIAIKNVSYSDALAYLKFEHDEFTNKPILDENGEMIRRQFVMLEGINCTPETYSMFSKISCDMSPVLFASLQRISPLHHEKN